MSWDFDSKEHSRDKYGNFSTPVVMKLVSKLNKKTGLQLDPHIVCFEVVQALNIKLKQHDDSSPRLKEKVTKTCMIREEVDRFEAMNGFINIFLTNEQFMDRVHVSVKKKAISNHDASPMGDM